MRLELEPATRLMISVTQGPAQLTRYNGYPAVSISGEPAPGYSTGQAIAALEEVGTQALPEDYGVAWTGQAFEETNTKLIDFLQQDLSQ